jgi:hypothetical protein
MVSVGSRGRLKAAPLSASTLTHNWNAGFMISG